ncbi:MAG: hypothetical protein ABSF10_07345 [Verrucomicrobiota bacterium]|jgi:hypothetical protein
MKTKSLIWIGLALQLGFLFFVLLFIPQQISTIKAGLQVLKETCPAAAPISPSDTGFVKLVAAGDYFLAASGGIKFLTVVTFCFVAVNVLLLLFALLSLRCKK